MRAVASGSRLLPTRPAKDFHLQSSAHARHTFIANGLPNDELLGESVRRQLVYYPTVTREPFRNQGRISLLLTSGKLTSDLGFPAIDPASDRFMLCGSAAMLSDLSAILEARGFEEANHGERGDYVIEKAFVEK